MFEHFHYPRVVKIHHLARSCGLLLVLLSLTIWAACDESVIGQQLSSLAAGSEKSADLADGIEGTTEVLEDAQLDPEAPTEPVDPADPPPPPHPCIEVALEMGHVCAEDTRDIAAECIETITQLFQEGYIDGAHAVARECIEHVNRHTEGCLHGLREHCHRCVEELIEEEAPIELIEAVIRACHEAAEHILLARRGALCAIEDAVDRGEAHFCAELVHRLAAECAERNDQIAVECVEHIEELLAAGQTEEAVEAADHCIRQIRRHSAECAREIQDITQNCLQRLMRHCAGEELIQLVLEARELSLRLVFGSAHEAIQQIRTALPPP